MIGTLGKFLSLPRVLMIVSHDRHLSQVKSRCRLGSDPKYIQAWYAQFKRILLEYNSAISIKGEC